MDLSFYQPSDMEKWISSIYQKNRIYYASDLEIDRITTIFPADVQAHPEETKLYWDGEYALIYLYAYLSEKEKRGDFFHEISHVIRHIGNQYNMPQSFTDLQEMQANQLQLYVALPYYMLQEYIEEYHTIQALQKTLEEEFRLPESLVKRRLQHIENRIYWERRNQIDRQPIPKTVITAEHVKRVQEEWGRKRREKEERERMI
jgi:Zn-dependent peptidase ImmA (M78 family)